MYILMVLVCVLAIVTLSAVAVLYMKKNKKQEAEQRGRHLFVKAGRPVYETSGLDYHLLMYEDDIMGEHPKTQGQAPVYAELYSLADRRLYKLCIVDYVEFGRYAENDDRHITIANGSISRRHCRLIKRNNGIFIEDLNSKYHTYVNGVLVTGATPLQSADIVKMAANEFEFRMK